MARVTDIINQWGRQGGPNPQRTDLWQVDLSFVIEGLNKIAGDKPQLPQIPRYFCSSITLPELKVKVETYKRDSRPYNMPVEDEPLDSFKMTFVVDDGGKRPMDPSMVAQSTIYSILDVWRSVVRAGRGSMGSEGAVLLDENFRIDYAFPVYVYLLRGQNLPAAFVNNTTTKLTVTPSTQQATFEGGFISEELSTATQQLANMGFKDFYSQQSALEVSGVLRLEKCWLAGFKLSDLSYDKSGVLSIDATFYADNLMQDRRKDLVPTFL